MKSQDKIPLQNSETPVGIAANHSALDKIPNNPKEPSKICSKMFKEDTKKCVNKFKEDTNNLLNKF